MNKQSPPKCVIDAMWPVLQQEEAGDSGSAVLALDLTPILHKFFY